MHLYQVAKSSGSPLWAYGISEICFHSAPRCSKPVVLQSVLDGECVGPVDQKTPIIAHLKCGISGVTVGFANNYHMAEHNRVMYLWLIERELSSKRF